MGIILFLCISSLTLALFIINDTANISKKAGDYLDKVYADTLTISLGLFSMIFLFTAFMSAQNMYIICAILIFQLIFMPFFCYFLGLSKTHKQSCLRVNHLITALGLLGLLLCQS